jgi:hypothetical protein
MQGSLQQQEARAAEAVNRQGQQLQGQRGRRGAAPAAAALCLSHRGTPHLAEVFFRVTYLFLHRQSLRWDSTQHGQPHHAGHSSSWRVIQPAPPPAHRALWWQTFEGVEERQRQALVPGNKDNTDSSAETRIQHVQSCSAAKGGLDRNTEALTVP